MSSLSLSKSASRIGASVFADLAPQIEHHRRIGADVIELHIGDSYREPPKGARFSAVDPPAFESSIYRYGDVTGLLPLRQKFASHLLERAYGPIDIDPAREVLVGCGATHALFCASRAILDAGDEVLVAAPYWPLAPGVLRAAGGVPIEMPLFTRNGANPTLDLEANLETAITERTRAIYFASPNNPDGAVLTRPHLEAIARAAKRRNLWVIADEVYADYVYDGEHVSIARLKGMKERTVSVYSLSKACALAGVRVGFVVAPDSVVAAARRVAVHTVFNVPVAAQQVALAALAEASAWIAETRIDYIGARGATLEALRAVPVDLEFPQGGSYAFVNFARALGGRPLRGLLERALERGVLLAPGDGFGSAFGTFGRLCFTAVPRPRLLDGIARLQRAIEDFGANPRD